MPRLARNVFSNIPHHITQRGNRREDVFFTQEDRQFYLQWLGVYCQKWQVDILAVFDPDYPLQSVTETGTVSLRYVDYAGNATENYPYNPNGSPEGITGLTTESGQFTIMMPHPERLFRSVQYSWRPDEWGEEGAWMRMFRNARVFVN